MFCLNFIPLINKVCLYPSLLFVDGNSSAEQHGEMFSSGTNTTEYKMCVEREHVSGKKHLPLFPVKLMVRLEKTQFLWRVYLNCDTKDIVNRQRDLWHHSAVLLTVVKNLLLVWILRPKGSLKEESELEAILGLGEGFGIGRAAADMKFGAAWWLKLLSHETFCSMDTVELRFSVGECFADIPLITLNFTLISRRGRSTILPTEGAREMQSQKEAYLWVCGLYCCKWGVSFYWFSIIIWNYRYFFTQQ